LLKPRGKFIVKWQNFNSGTGTATDFNRNSGNIPSGLEGEQFHSKNVLKIDRKQRKSNGISKILE
jgi:hypothetical protein